MLNIKIIGRRLISYFRLFAFVFFGLIASAEENTEECLSLYYKRFIYWDYYLNNDAVLRPDIAEPPADRPKYKYLFVNAYCWGKEYNPSYKSEAHAKKACLADSIKMNRAEKTKSYVCNK